ncbi:MAG: ThuA domain-containing protein [Clostridia bacterium]
MTTNITVWNEGRHEKENKQIASVYPKGIHGAIADHLGKEKNFSVRTATLDDPEQGLPDAVLSDTDVLIWWGHCAHGEVRDELVERIRERVNGGMGIIVLHSGHYSKIFKKLLGTSGTLKWREVNEKTRLWVVNPNHPIAEGIGPYIELPGEEMYGEPFGIPNPDELVFISWFEGGEVFRSGCCFQVERGRMFYFQPGHETYPIYHHPEIMKVIANACRWAAPTGKVMDRLDCENVKVPLEEVGK